MSQKVITRAEIAQGLRLLGLERGAPVEVHSSLSSLGWVEGGAEAVIEALIEVVDPEGALIMSAYPVTPALPLSEEERARGMTWKVRILEDPHDRTGLGLIVDTFRKRPDVILGKGLHRVCAWGCESARHAASGYRYLVEIDGWTMLIGVGVDRVSSLHIAEEDPGLPEEIHHLIDPPAGLLRDYPPDCWSIGFGGTPEDAWTKVWSEANRLGLVRTGRIGQADCALFNTRAVLAVYQDWLRNDPFGLFGVQHKESC